MKLHRFAVCAVACAVVFTMGAFAAPPTVSITYPVSGQVVQPYDWDSVLVVASASDDGIITKVTLLVDRVEVKTFEQGPFGLQCMIPAAMKQTVLVAKAYDNEGYAVESEDVLLTISRKANARITYPAPKQAFSVGGVGVQSTVSIPEFAQPGVINYYYDAVNYIHSAVEPWQITWDYAPAGSYVLHGEFFDRFGGKTLMPSVGITVGAGSDIISMNFGEKCVAASSEIGVVPAKGWNSYLCMDPCKVYDNRGRLTGMTVTTDATTRYTNETWVINDETAMMSVYKGKNGSSTFYFNNVPFDIYDVYILWGGYATGVMELADVTMTLNGKGSYVVPGGNEWKHSYLLATATAPRDPRDQSSILETEIPNYAFFPKISDRSFSVTISNMQGQPVGINAIQIVNKGTASTIKDLTLTSMCSSDPAKRRWRVRNPNTRSISAKWTVVGTTQTGNIIAAPGDSYFFTQSVAGPNTTKLSWYNESEVLRETVKASSGAICQ